MSACAYIFNDKQSTLIMAKNKLPSIKSNPTISEMEMDALTIGARLAISIVTALESDPYHSYLRLLVSNRLKELRRIVEALHKEGVQLNLRFVPTNENPADAGTRGLTKAQVTHFGGTDRPF
ncbi:unnamed protein product [Haemonchus placei]|uniref:RNase H domain-containing protein n=1 Tax=Haemonchus placei TaxID=6290 RepID=A0A0N4WMM8_HAEPC|nr:unnamed protein product [Haemonchus placei]